MLVEAAKFKIFKVQGVDVVSEYSEKDSDTLIFTDPLTILIVPGAAGTDIKMMPLAPFDKSGTIEINKRYIVFSHDVNDEILQYYKETAARLRSHRTGIISPSSYFRI